MEKITFHFCAKNKKEIRKLSYISENLILLNLIFNIELLEIFVANISRPLLSMSIFIEMSLVLKCK